MGAGDVLRHVVGQMEAIVLSLLLENGDFRLQVRRAECLRLIPIQTVSAGALRSN